MPTPGEEVRVSVHERTDAPDYVVRVEHAGRVSKIAVGELDEAQALAESIVEFVKLGLPVEALLGEDA